MRVRQGVAVAALIFGLGTASRVEAAACNCAGAHQHTVHHRAHHQEVPRTEIVYGDRRSPSRTAPAPASAQDAQIHDAAEPAYEPYPPYYGYGYAAQVVYGPGWGGYRAVGRYSGYGWRNYPFAGRYPGYGWRGVHHAGSVGGGGPYGWRR